MKQLSRGAVLWILHNFITLEEGHLPMEYSNYTELPMIKKGGTWAYFELAVGLAATVSIRLDKCGFDGVLVYLVYCFERDPKTVARMLGLQPHDIYKRTSGVIDYISNKWPKNGVYKHYKMHTVPTRKANSRNFIGT